MESPKCIGCSKHAGIVKCIYCDDAWFCQTCTNSYVSEVKYHVIMTHKEKLIEHELLSQQPKEENKANFSLTKVESQESEIQINIFEEVSSLEAVTYVSKNKELESILVEDSLVKEDED